MLPLELLRARTRKGQIQPIYADINRQNLGFANDLLRLFKKHIDNSKGELLEKVSDYETGEFDYRLVRGLSAILQRLCSFQVDAAVDPLLIRQIVYERTSQSGVVVTEESRKEILGEVAARLEITRDELERSFYADLDDQLVLRDFTPTSATELLKQYNLSLTQTLLFRSTFIEIKVSDCWKEILREIKFRGLMYSAESKDGRFQITVDGPFSLLKLTQRYGTSMAKVLPLVIQANQWEINGNVVRAGQFGKRILRLRLSSVQLGEKITPTTLRKKKKAIQFDSQVEKKFFQDFQSLKTGWKLTREPHPLIAGRHVFLPDFSFEKRGKTVYMEIVGFWTTRYLQMKIEKLQQLEGVDIIIAANEQLACEKIRQVKGEVVFYRKNVPLRPILNFLKNLETILLHREIQSVNLARLCLTSDVVDLHKMAKEYGVSHEALKRKLESHELEGYTLTGELLLNNRVLRRMDQKIAALSNPSLSQALGLIEDEGFARPYDILSALDYCIKWNGLDPDKSSIHKKTTESQTT